MRLTEPGTPGVLENLQTPLLTAVKARGLGVQQIAPLAVIAFLATAFSFAGSHFATWENLQAILEAAAIPLILAVGETFVILLGSIDLSIEGVMGASCMTFVLLVKNNVNSHDLGLWGVALALLVGVGIGLANGFLNAYLRLPSLITTIGTWSAALGMAYIIFPSHQPGLLDERLLDFALDRRLALTPVFYLAAGVTIIAYLVCRYTEFGRMIYAIGGDEVTAIAAGVPVKRFRVAAFAVAGTLFALAGVLVGTQLENGNPNIGHDLLFPTIGAAVIGGTQLSGGRGGPLYSAAGVFILVILDNGMIQVGAGPYTRNILIGAAIVAAVATANWHKRRKLRVIK
jgi:ribose transport system permease protein